MRNGKHCRERWLNHLDPNLKKCEWTPEEDQTICTNQSAIGNKWSVISKLLPGRTENQVKNRWKSILRKVSKNIKSKTNCVKVEWGGEVGYGEGSDCGDVGFEDAFSLLAGCGAIDNDIGAYDEFMNSPSYFYT